MATVLLFRRVSLSIVTTHSATDAPTTKTKSRRSDEGAPPDFLNLFSGTKSELIFVAMSNILDGIERLHQALDYHLERQNLLTANLTHIDTPGYKPLDLERGAAFQGELSTAMATTDSGHIASSVSSPDFKV